jgi:hypothetical protein
MGFNKNCTVCKGTGWMPKKGSPEDAETAKLFGLSVDELELQPCNADGNNMGCYKAENWGGDPEGKLAKALERAREKAKQPRKPLKIERLKAEKIDYSSWICPVEEEFDFGEGMEKYECGSTDYRIVKDSASPTGYTVECSSCRSDISYDHEPYLQAKEAYEEKERKRIKQRYGAESPQVDDEGMLGRIRKVRIAGIEDNNSKKDRKGNPIQNVYFYRDLLDSGEADWRIHTDSEREFLSRFKPDKRAESFGADYYYKGDRRSGFSIVKGGFKYGKDRMGGTTLATITKGNALQAHYWRGDEARARSDANRTMWEVHLKENNVRRSFSKRKDAIDFVFSTLGISKEDMESESYGAETRSLAKRSWDALNNVETAVGTVGLAHMIGLGAIIGGSFAFLKGRKSNSKTEQ